MCSNSVPSSATLDRSMVHLARRQGSHHSMPNTPSLSLRTRVCHPNTRTSVRLLGPCFKTGRLSAFRQHLQCASGLPKPHTTRSRHLLVPATHRMPQRQPPPEGSHFHSSASAAVSPRVCKNHSEEGPIFPRAFSCRKRGC